ncbi:MAG TPA: hypothetical protein PLN21_11910 [Gemmatales bacterium]|nr:hypothetical protein [Gemmatales bacterium]
MREMIMSQATSDMQVLCLFSIGLALSSYGVLGLISRRQHGVRNSLIAWTITWSVIAMIRPDKIGFSAGFACLGVLVFLLFTCTSPLAGFRILFQHMAVRRYKNLFLVIGGIAVVGATLNYIDLREAEDDTRQLGAIKQLTFLQLKCEPRLKVVTVLPTELGNNITLRQPAEDGTSENIKEYEELFFKVNVQWGAKLIHTQPASDECNCHGWVFAKGQFWITSQDVETIIHDDNYRRVTLPTTGDLAIYRNENGQIIHSAIVRGRVNKDILVEGKWGPLGVYLHFAKNCSYGERIEYYHRPFSINHALAGLETFDKSEKLIQSAKSSLTPATPTEQ